MSLNLDKTAWKRVTFGEVIENVTDRVDDPAKAGVDRYVGLEHLDPGTMSLQRWDSPDKVAAQKLRFQPGDVIFGRRRAYQKKLAFADFEGICSAHALVLRARPDHIVSEFLPVFLSSDYFLDRAIAISVGSLSPTVNWRDLKVQEFVLPPIDAQKRIAELLWAIERHHHSKRSEIEIAAAAMLLSRAGFVNDPTARMVRAREAFEFSTGVRRTPDRAHGCHMTPYLRSANVGYGELDLSDVQEMNYEPDERERFQLRRGDVLVSEGSASATAVGMPARWADELPSPVCFQMTLLRLRAVPALCLPGFVFHWSMWAYESGAFLEVAGGTNIKHISALRSSEMPVRLPSLDEQRVRVDQLESMGRAVASLQMEVKRLNELRGALLSEVFGGT